MKDQYEAKYQSLINNQGSTHLKPSYDSKDFIKYSNDMGDIYKTTEEYSPNKKK